MSIWISFFGEPTPFFQNSWMLVNCFVMQQIYTFSHWVMSKLNYFLHHLWQLWSCPSSLLFLWIPHTGTFHSYVFHPKIVKLLFSSQNEHNLPHTSMACNMCRICICWVVSADLRSYLCMVVVVLHLTFLDESLELQYVNIPRCWLLKDIHLLERHRRDLQHLW